MPFELERALDVARRAVEAAAKAALVHFEREMTVEKKADRSPVTAADREAEAAIVEVISETYPDHRILAEEGGPRGGQSSPDYRWLIDPIDGTRGFTRGGKFWGPLVACEKDGEIVVGAMAMPALEETYWAARDLGAYKNGARLQVSSVDDWEGEAILNVGEPGYLLATVHANGIIELMKTAASTRCYGDLAGCVEVLNGRAEVWVEASDNPWDLAPTKILVEEAGGRVSDFRGKSSLESGTVIGSNGRVHDHVLDLLNPRA